jgi:putative ABC transport system permease protein
MSLWRQITHGLRVLRNRNAADEAIADEVSHYVQETTAAYVAKGFTPEEAQRAARLEIGSATAVREEVCDNGWENRIDSLFSRLRYTVQRRCGSSGFTVVSVLTLAMGIGTSTAIFSVIDGVMLKPLPYPQSDRIVALLHAAPGLNMSELNLAVSLYLYSEENRVFQDVGMWAPWAGSMTGLGAPEKVRGLTVSNRFLAVLGVPPAFGRGFTAGDENPQSERAVVLSNGFWKSRFGGDRAVLGRCILLDGDAYAVIGVMPPSFQFLDQQVSMLIPFRYSRAKVNLISFCCQGVTRLKPGVTMEQANADVARMPLIAPAKFPINPGFSKTSSEDARIAPRLRPLKSVLVGDVGNALSVLMGAVAIVLSIACASLASLWLVRADGRRQELAIRTALGAGWGRIAQELLLESMLM